MFKIGEFSRLGQVSVRMLRHYDTLDLLTPSHTDPFTSYRYYTVDQLPRLHRIVALNSLGLTLEQVGTLLQAGDVSNERLRGMLALRQAELEQELAARAFQLRAVAARLRQLEAAAMPPYEIVVRPLEALVIASVRTCVPTIAAMATSCALLYSQLYRVLARHGITPLSPELMLYHTEEYIEINLDSEAAVAVEPALRTMVPRDEELTVRELPGVAQAASLIFQGAFDDLPPAVLALLGWVGTHGFRPAGPLRELHLSGPAHPNCGPTVTSAVFELQLPVQSL